MTICDYESMSWAYITFPFLIFITVLSLLTMIFTIKPKNSKENTYTTYFKRNDSIIDKYNLNYYVNQTYITDIEFGKYDYNYDLYGTTGVIGIQCFSGSCSNQKEYTSRNCSEACAIYADMCEVNNKTCTDVYCQSTIYTEESFVCHVYNQINFWRGQRMKITKKNFTFLQINDTVLSNETCREGYKQCGYLNKYKNKLCINVTENCPINKVIIKNDNITPTDFNYTMRQLGDKFLFYTHENTNNFMYINIIADSKINSTNCIDVIIDNQSLSDFLSENPYIYDGKYTSKSGEELTKYGDAKLKMCEYSNQKNVYELRKMQDKYTERLTLYTKEKLKEMNENVVKNKDLLLIFSVTKFIYTLIVAIFVIGFFLCLHKCEFSNPFKKTLICYLLFSPSIFFNIYCFILVIQNKIIFDQYYAMKYINDFIHCENIWTYQTETDDNGDIYKEYWECENVCFFDDLNYYNNSSFICYIITTVLMILYPSIIILSFKNQCKCPKLFKNDNDKKQKLNKSDNFKPFINKRTPGACEMKSTL